MKNIAVCIMAAWWFAACGNPVTSPERVDEWPDIYPDYIGVTIPATIAPMNFNCIGGVYERVDVTVTGGKSGEMHVKSFWRRTRVIAFCLRYVSGKTASGNSTALFLCMSVRIL